MKFRHAVGALLAAVAITAGIGTAASATTTPVIPACTGVTFTTHVANRLDSGLHGDWAQDTFDRVTKVTCNADGSYLLQLIDTGTFAPLPGALSPSAGVPIHNLPFVGSFVGGMAFTVTSATAPVDPKAGADGKYSSSAWAGLVFPNGKITPGGWGWTYSRMCDRKPVETWKNAAAGNVGDITGEKKCFVPTPSPSPVPTSTTGKPPTSTPATPTTTPATPVVITNPGQFQTVPNVSKGIDTGDGSLS